MVYSLHSADLSPFYHLLQVSGADRTPFLQGLLTQDVTHVTPDAVRFAALLTPAGRFLADMMVLSDGESLFLLLSAGQSVAVQQRLSLYKLRSQVALTLITNIRAQVVWGESAADVATALNLPPQPGACHYYSDGGWRFVDPRHPALAVWQLSLGQLSLGQQHPLPHPIEPTNAGADDFRYHQLGLGVPDGATDLEPERSIILEYGYDAMGALSWNKGCYIGQELMARTHHRGQVRKALLPARLLLPEAASPLPPPGCPVLAGAEEVGEWRAGLRDRGLILVKQDLLAQAQSVQTPLTVAGLPLLLNSTA